MRLKCLFWSVCLLFFASDLCAQETLLATDGQYLTIGLGIPIHTYRDNAHSPLAYRGNGFRLFLGYEKLRENVVSEAKVMLDFASTKAYVRPKQDVKGSGSLSNMRFHLGYYFRLGEVDPTEQSYVGFAYEVEVGNWEFPTPTNNTTGFLVDMNLSAAFLHRRGFDREDWSARGSARVPVLNVLFRPNYIGLPDPIAAGKFKASYVFDNLHWGTFNNLTKLNVNLNLDHQAEAWRTNRFEYDWQLRYSPVPKGRSVITTAGALAYGYRVLL